MKPTIGRIVLYSHEGQVLVPAIIIKVWSEVCVNLHTFGDGVAVQPALRTSVTLLGEDGGPEPNHWAWPKREP